MKIYFSLMILVLSLNEASSSAIINKKSLIKNEKIDDKIYSVDKTSPEILIGESRLNSVKNRPPFLWHAGIVRSNLNYQMTSLTNSSRSFSPHLVGLIVGIKVENQLFFSNGYYEMNGEWQRFNRESLFGNNIIFSQNLNLYQINIFQNFLLNFLLRGPALFSAGIGVAPVYLTTEQSVFGNSTETFGYLGLLKVNVAYPIYKNYELDISLKFGEGVVNMQTISTTSLLLGLNFE